VLRFVLFGGLTSNPPKIHNNNTTNLSKSDGGLFCVLRKSIFWQKPLFFDQTNTRNTPLKPFFNENSSFTVFFTQKHEIDGFAV
jgi:hypothetical protein